MKKNEDPNLDLNINSDKNITKNLLFQNKNKKTHDFNDIKNYKPSGNLIYNNNLLDKLKI